MFTKNVVMQEVQTPFPSPLKRRGGEKAKLRCHNSITCSAVEERLTNRCSSHRPVIRVLHFSFQGGHLAAVRIHAILSDGPLLRPINHSFLHR